MFNDMNGLQAVERAVPERVRKVVQVAKNVGAAPRIAVDAQRARQLVDAAADVQNQRSSHPNSLAANRLDALFQHVQRVICLVLAQHQRRRQANRVLPCPQHQHTPFERHLLDPVA